MMQSEPNASDRPGMELHTVDNRDGHTPRDYDVAAPSLLANGESTTMILEGGDGVGFEIIEIVSLLFRSHCTHFTHFSASDYFPIQRPHVHYLVEGLPHCSEYRPLLFIPLLQPHAYPRHSNSGALALLYILYAFCFTFLYFFTSLFNGSQSCDGVVLDLSSREPEVGASSFTEED